MRADPTNDPSATKPTTGAVRDTITALANLVRSMRASAKATASRVGVRARAVKSDLRAHLKAAGTKTGRRAGAKVRAVGRRISSGLERAREVLTDGGSTAPGKARRSSRAATTASRRKRVERA